MCRGDFPAFYTASFLYNTKPESLYDSIEQASVQSQHWSSLEKSHLYFSYPPYVAFLLKPLSYFNPSISKLLYSTFMFVLFVLALKLYKVAFDKLFILSMLFFPNLSAIFSGQNLALSLLCFSLISKFIKYDDKKSNLIVGLATGFWFFKPHFALIALLGLIALRKYLAVFYTLCVMTSYFLIAYFDWNKNWILLWLSKTKEFYHLDTAFNGDKLISFTGFFENLSYPFIGYILSALLLMFFIYNCIKTSTIDCNADSIADGFIDKPVDNFIKYLPFVIILSSPHTMYYDSGLIIIPFLTYLISKHNFKYLLYLTSVISSLIVFKINLILLTLMCLILSLSYLNFCPCSVNNE